MRRFSLTIRHFLCFLLHILGRSSFFLFFCGMSEADWPIGSSFTSVVEHFCENIFFYFSSSPVDLPRKLEYLLLLLLRHFGVVFGPVPVVM